MRGAREGKVIAMEGRPLTLQLAQSKVEVTRLDVSMLTIVKLWSIILEAKQVIMQTKQSESRRDRTRALI